MRKAASEYVDFVLRTLPSGQLATVRVDHEAAELFGWPRHYDCLKDHLVGLHGTAGYGYTARSISRRSRGSSKKAVVWMPAPDGSGKKSRQVSLGLGAKVSRFDLIELAHFIECDWHHMTGPDGRRHPKQWWEEAYQKGPPASQETLGHSWGEMFVAPAA